MHTDEQSPIGRFRDTCCYSSMARRGAALPPGIQHSPDCLCSYMCTAVKHVNSALFYQKGGEEGGEREHIPRGLHGLYSFPNPAYLTRKRRERDRERDREREGKRETTQAVTEKLQ